MTWLLSIAMLLGWAKEPMPKLMPHRGEYIGENKYRVVYELKFLCSWYGWYSLSENGHKHNAIVQDFFKGGD